MRHYGDLILILGSSIFYLLKGDYRVRSFKLRPDLGLRFTA